MSEILLIGKSEGIATVTLNRPVAMNALSRKPRREIVRTFPELKRDADVAVVIQPDRGVLSAPGST
jgi:enoyl-CoA hydratase